VGAELLPAGRRQDMKNLSVALRNFPKGALNGEGKLLEGKKDEDGGSKSYR